MTAAIDFPNSPPPNNGDTYTPANGITYTYNNGKWKGNVSSGPADQLINGSKAIRFESSGILSSDAGNTIRLRSSGQGGATSIEYIDTASSQNPYNAKVQAGNQYVHIHTAGDINVWSFDSDGGLTLPGDFYIGPGEGSLGITSPDAVAIIANQGTTDQLWLFGTDGNLTLPAGGTINNTDGITLGTDRGTLAMGTNMEVPGVAGHFHIAFDGSNSNPPANDMFLGDDHNYVKLPGYELNPTAQFGVEIGTNNRSLGPQNVEVLTVDELVPPGGVWRFFIDHDTYPNLGSSVSVGDTVTTSWGTPITATITDVIEEPGVRWKIHVAQDITAGFSVTDTVSFGTPSDSHTWRFDTDGKLTFPDTTAQTTAYRNRPQNNLNLSGGTASTVFEIDMTYVDCGGSVLRGILAQDQYDGYNNGSTTTSFDKVLDGGQA